MAIGSGDSARSTLDIWAERWGDSALQELGRWLISHGIPDVTASLAVDEVWVFYSYHILPLTDHRIPLGIAAKQNKAETVVRVYLPLPNTSAGNRGIDVETQNSLEEIFGHVVAQHTRYQLLMRLQFMMNTSEKRFERQVRGMCKAEDLEFLGTFADRLQDELAKIMPLGMVETWLNAPNTLFAGERPAALLVSPKEDRPLRDLIQAVKHGMVS